MNLGFFWKASLASVGNLFHNIYSRLGKPEMVMMKDSSVLSEAEVSLRTREMQYKTGQD